MESDLKGHALQAFCVHHTVKLPLRIVFQSQQKVFASQSTPVKRQLERTCMCQPMGGDITIVPPFKPNTVRRLTELHGDISWRINQLFFAPAFARLAKAS